MLTATRRFSQPFLTNFRIPKRSTSTIHIPSILEDHSEIKSHQDLWEFSIKKPQEFWGQLARKTLTWSRPFSKVMDCDMSRGIFKWFEDGQLNVTVNCLDRHVAENPNKVALIWEKDEPGEFEVVTFKELLEMTCRIANVLKSHGIKKGDVVAIYMPTSPIAVASMMACARIGALHSVIFAGFSPGAITSRINDASAKVIITANEAVRGGKTIALRKTVEDAISSRQCPSLEYVFVTNRTGDVSSIFSTDISLEKEMKKESSYCDPEIMNSEDLLFILYTSGSTGTPKGVAHSTAGYLLYSSFTQKHVFQCYGEYDIFGCVADIGWITGHSYVIYGPLANGRTSLLFESTPTYPDPSRYWDTVEKHKVTQFYCAPTAVRLLMKYGDDHATSRDLSSLKTIGSVGEPINPEAWHWLNTVVGRERCDLVDTWWQTETGGICLSPRPSREGAPILPGMAMRAMPGINPVLMDDKGREISEEKNVDGLLCLKTPWPGIARTVYNSHERYLKAYFSDFPGYYFSGDGARRDEKGYWQITGRVDDVINITGHRLGTAEVEGVIGKHDLVAEAACVGYPHPIKGESVYAYVVLKDRAFDQIKGSVVKQEKLREDLKERVKANIAGFAVPDYIQFSNSLPKTRSGKIMRRILRKIAAGQYKDLGDTSTLSEEDVVKSLIARHKALINSSKM